MNSVPVACHIELHLNRPRYPQLSSPEHRASPSRTNFCLAPPGAFTLCAPSVGLNKANSLLFFIPFFFLIWEGKSLNLVLADAEALKPTHSEEVREQRMKGEGAVNRLSPNRRELTSRATFSAGGI